MATSTQIGQRALEKLTVVAPDDTPSTEDQATADEIYASVYQEMRVRHLVDWGSGDEVPTGADQHMIDLVANRMANRFGKPRNAEEEKMAIAGLARHIAADPVDEPVKADYY